MIVATYDGLVTVTLDDTLVRLRRPTLVEYAQFADAAELALLHLGLAAGRTTIEPETAFATDSDHHRVFASILSTLSDVDIPADPPVWATHPQATVDLLEAIALPIDPWSAPRPTISPKDAVKVPPSSIPGWQGRMAQMYRALRPMHPADVDRLELWQVAALLGLDEAPDGGPALPEGRTVDPERGLVLYPPTS